jgi:phage-related baseplate assembly protein
VIAGAELLEAIRAVVREELVRALAPRDTLTPPQRAVFRAVARLYVVGEAWTASGALDAARFDSEAAAALRQACGADVQRLGIALGQLADAGAVLDGLRLVRLPKEENSRRWALVGAESL